MMPCATKPTLTAVAGLLLSACASANLDSYTGPTSGSAAQPLESLAANDPKLKGKEVVAVRAPEKSFGFGAAFFGAESGATPAPVPRTDANLYDIVSVYWGTDRQITPKTAPVTDTADITTGAIKAIKLPSAERGSKLSLGRAQVTIPKVAREKGAILRPWQVTFLNYTIYSETEDPRKHFTIGNLESFGEAEFINATNNHLSRAKRFKDQAFVYVHGFNISFDEAIYRAAQLAYDLEFDGVPYAYSWPSQGEETAYLYDRDSADRARRYFLEFLEFVAKKTKAKRIHIIAHSLGNRTIVEAIQHASLRPGRAEKLKLGQLILAAPDIDRDVFTDIASILTKSSRGATLYAANNDRALQISRTLAYGKPRVGEILSDGPVVVRGIDTIDISEAGQMSWLSVNHTTYVRGTHLLTDLKLLLQKGTRPPNKRFAVYKPKTAPGGTYWKYERN